MSIKIDGLSKAEILQKLVKYADEHSTHNLSKLEDSYITIEKYQELLDINNYVGGMCGRFIGVKFENPIANTDFNTVYGENALEIVINRIYEDKKAEYKKKCMSIATAPIGAFVTIPRGVCFPRTGIQGSIVQKTNTSIVIQTGNGMYIAPINGLLCKDGEHEKYAWEKDEEK